MLENFAVIGGGSWGTALGCLFARIFGKVLLYTLEEKTVNEINNKHQNNKYLGDVILPSAVSATSRIKDIMAADVIILAIPSHAFTDILMQLRQAGLPENTILLVATKGLCENPVQLFSSKIESEFNNPYAFISGPNFAREVAEDKFTAVTISSKDASLAQMLAGRLASAQLDTTFSTDIVTIQIASIVKNIAAIKSGIMQASGAGENARAWLVSRALADIAIISKALGGNAETLTLPAVIGDLTLTCYSTTSRNTRFGHEFHRSNYSREFLNNYPILVEGVSSARLLDRFLKEHNFEFELPIVSSIADIV